MACQIMSYAIYRETIRYLLGLKPGDQYPQAFDEANRMLQEALDRLERKGTPLAVDSAAYKELKKSIVPPYDPGKFPNKWRKMWRDEPARTLMAHLGKDSYSHIHYDHEQARTISVREAARLQSFPDGFKFSGNDEPCISSDRECRATANVEGNCHKYSGHP